MDDLNETVFKCEKRAYLTCVGGLSPINLVA